MPDPTQNAQSNGNPPSDDQNPTNAGFAPLPDEQSTQSAGIPFAKTGVKQIAITKADIEKFEISEEIIKENPALVDLVLKTESMKDEERKYWFQLLPIMSEDQVKKLQDILQNEKDQLTELDTKYAKEVSRLNEKQPNWDPNAAKEKRKKVQEDEAAHQKSEKNAEADILSQLNNL